MVKKIILAIVLLSVVGGVGYMFYLWKAVEEHIPDMMDGAKFMYIDSCENDEACVKAINDYFDECRLNNYITDVGVMNFQDKYLEFMLNTNKCIESKSNLELPSFMDHLMEERLNEIESP